MLIHPCPDSVLRIDWQLDRRVDLEQERRDGTLDHRVSQVLGGAPYEMVWASLYRFHARVASRLRVGRVFLAGVADVDNLAWKLAAVLRGWAPEDLLDSYEAERMAAARENLAVTTTTMDFLVPGSERALARRREVLERAVSDPAARGQVDSGRPYEPFRYVDFPLTTPTRRVRGRDGRRPVRPDAHTAARAGRAHDLVPAARRMLSLAEP